MYQFDQKPNTVISKQSLGTIEQIMSSEYAVLVGRNNCGKSFLLKELAHRNGQEGTYIGPGRHQNFHILEYYRPNRNRKGDRWSQFHNMVNDPYQNHDNSQIALQQCIAELTDIQREHLSEIVKMLLGTDLDIRHTDESNSMSQKYVSCGGHNISYTSSGFRLITTLITGLLDETFQTFFLDEPELGISPEAQGIIADFLFDRSHRAKYFPHIKTLVLATHSTIFLDRHDIKNNYTVEKQDSEITVTRINDQAAFNRVHFFLLGNRFETLYLPSAIIFVEGKCDFQFIERVLTTRYPNYQFSILEAGSDSRIKPLLSNTKSVLSDLQKSPYRDRIFIILDSSHSKGLVDELIGMGVLKENVIIWPKNGIEYYYPPAVIDKIFGAGNELELNDDVVSRNGLSYKKAELAKKVVVEVDCNTQMDETFTESFLKPFETRLGITNASMGGATRERK